jgi:hypothetical protein
MSAVPTPSVLARRMNRAFLEARLDELEVLIDDKAEIASFLDPEQILRGRDAIMDASRRARQTSVFSVALHTVRNLSATVALGTGSVRYPRNDAIATSQAAWLWKWHEGRLVRSVHYPTEDEALAHYDDEADDFELP